MGADLNWINLPLSPYQVIYFVDLYASVLSRHPKTNVLFDLFAAWVLTHLQHPPHQQLSRRYEGFLFVFLLFSESADTVQFIMAGYLKECFFVRFSSCQIWTRDGWVRSANATAVLCRPPKTIRRYLCTKVLLQPEWINADSAFSVHFIHSQSLNGDEKSKKTRTFEGLSSAESSD